MAQIADFIQKVITNINNLSPGEIKIIIAATALLILYLVFRRLGLLAALFVLMVYLIAYVLYAGNVFNFYQQNQQTNNQHMQTIENELQKD
jgi:Ca2+/Na+ antiporter